MVLFRSPVQAVARLTSPLVVVEEAPQPQPNAEDAPSVHNHDPDEKALLLETPGKPEHLWSQRIQESLNAVAASPNSKINAPAPFASSSKLRRSPPAHHVSLQQPVMLADQQEQQHDEGRLASQKSMMMDAEQVEDPFVKRARVERTPPGAATFPDTRESQSQSRALFDDRGPSEPARASTAQLASPSLSASLMPLPTSLHRHRASLPDASILRSAPMVASTSRLSAQSTPTQRASSVFRQPGTPEVARIGRLNARIALLESQKEAADAGREAVEVRNKALEEKCQFLETDQADKQARLAEYEALAEEWEGTLNDYGALQLEVDELRKRHLDDEAGLFQLREDQAERKLKEKKYRNELRWRQAESRWRDLTVVSKNRREAEVQLIGKNLKVIELTRAYNMERASSEYFKGCLEDVEEELQELQEAYTSVKQRSSSLSTKCTAAENNSAQALRKLAKLEQENTTLHQEKERLEDQVAQLNAAENASQATSSQVVDLQKQVRQREKELAKVSAERDNTAEQLKELNNELKSLEAEVNQKDKKIRSLEQRIEYDEEERRQVDAAREAEEENKRDVELAYQQEHREMHDRAKKAFGSQEKQDASQSQSGGLQHRPKSKTNSKGTKEAEKSVAQAVDSKTAKASKPKAQSKVVAKSADHDDNDDDDDESFGLPPPLSTNIAATRDKHVQEAKQHKPKPKGAQKETVKASSPGIRNNDATSDEEEEAPLPPKKVSKKASVAHPSKARKSMGRPSMQPLSDESAIKRKRVEDVEDDSDGGTAENLERPPKKTKKSQKAESSKTKAEQRQAEAKPAEDRAKKTVSKPKKADSSTASAAAGNRKTALYGGNKSAFVWDQTAKGKSILQDLPDHLSPIKPSR